MKILASEQIALDTNRHRAVAALAGVMLLGASLVVGPAAWTLQLGGLACLAVCIGCRYLRPGDIAAHPLNLSALPPVCREIVAGIYAVAAHPDPVFRDLMASRFAQWVTQMRDWSQGRLVFADTESWRTAYEKVLAAPEISEYRSVAWLRSEHYWQDLPGRKGMLRNFVLLDQGVRIERILILGWNVWPPELRLPRDNILRWIEDQHYRGVSVWLLRETDLVGEPDLLRDFGIYGTRAVGELHLDSESRSVSFTLWFEPAAVELASEQWQRLTLYARPYAELAECSHLR